VGKDLPAYDVPLVVLQDQKSRGLPRFLRSAGVTSYSGQPVSRGIGQGKTVIIGTVEPPSREVPAKGLDRAWEEEQVKQSISAARARIENKMLEHLSATEAGILHAHLAILGDVSLLDKILEGVAQGYSAAQAVMDASRFFAGLLRQSDNPYTRERALDIQDICFQLLEDVSGPKLKSVVELKGPSVVIAENYFKSQQTNQSGPPTPNSRFGPSRGPGGALRSGTGITTGTPGTQSPNWRRTLRPRTLRRTPRKGRSRSSSRSRINGSRSTTT